VIFDTDGAEVVPAVLLTLVSLNGVVLVGKAVVELVIFLLENVIAGRLIVEVIIGLLLVVVVLGVVVVVGLFVVVLLAGNVVKGFLVALIIVLVDVLLLVTIDDGRVVFVVGVVAVVVVVVVVVVAAAAAAVVVKVEFEIVIFVELGVVKPVAGVKTGRLVIIEEEGFFDTVGRFVVYLRGFFVVTGFLVVNGLVVSSISLKVTLVSVIGWLLDSVINVEVAPVTFLGGNLVAKGVFKVVD
jgi:hypothetical protein